MAGKNCGTIPDGCGAILQCGPCPDGQTCGGGATANVCGAPAQTPGATRWVQILSTPGDDVMWGIGSDRDGNPLALWYATSDQALRLDRVSDTAVTRLGRYPVLPSADMTDVDQASLLVGGDGSLYAHSATSGPGYVDLGGNGAVPHASNEVAKLQADGAFLQDVNRCQLDCATQILAASANGDVVLLNSLASGAVSIDLFRSDGSQTPLYSWDGTNVSGPLASTGCWSAAFVPDGNLVCGGFSLGGAPVLPTNPGNTGFSASPAVLKLDLGGHVLWTDVLPLVGSTSGVGSTSAGTIVATGLFSGSAQFGNDRLDHPSTADYAGFLLTMGADGSLRWVRQLDHPGLSLAVDPSAGAAVITADSRFAPILGPVGPSNVGITNVVDYDAAGVSHWSRSIPPRFAGIAIRDHDVLVGGTWSGSFDFGTGAMTSAGDDGYVLDLAP